MSESTPRLKIDRLSFTGPERNQVTVEYRSGLNILWGASNHGKSFTAHSIDFVLGSKGPRGRGALTMPPEGNGFDRCVLCISINDTKLTLQRGVAGGDVEIADGHHDEILDGLTGYRKVSAKHLREGASLSGLLLDNLGFRQAELLRNERADKTAFTFRLLMRYIFIDEERIFTSESVIVRKGDQPTAEDKSLLKFITTGVDGSAIVTVPPSAVQKASRDGKVDVLRELLLQQSARINNSINDEELESARREAELTCADAESNVSSHQESIDFARATLRDSRSELRTTDARIADFQAMSLRFEELRRTFISDIDRLAGLEEGGYLLQKFAKLNCPLCGADPEHQEHDHHLQLVKQQQLAAKAEIRKTRAELKELDAAILGLSTDINLGKSNSEILQLRITHENVAYEELTAKGHTIRPLFLEAAEELRSIREKQERRADVQHLENRIAELENLEIPGRPKAKDFDPSITTDEAHSLAKVVKEVLIAWGYPNVETVSFDLGTNDLIVDGKERRNNGKGVRAILHSAFQVAVLIYCHNNARPHPRFLILDSPLLAYREPTPDYQRDEDDEVLAQTGIAERFYSHLSSISGIGQFIVIENATPPDNLPKNINQIQYDRGAGLFPT